MENNKKIKKILREIEKLTEEELMMFYRTFVVKAYFSFVNNTVDKIIKGEINDN